MWFKCYLSSRRQCVHINSSRSPFLPILSGVPQGSILGPILFLIYIDDLSSVVSSSSVLLFTGDTKCFKTIHDQSDAQYLQSDLNALGSWSNKWSVAFNESKCAVVHFHTKSDSVNYQYYLNNQAISKATMYRDLGVFVSNTLSWTHHYEVISSRALKSSVYTIVHFRKITLSKQRSYCTSQRSDVSYSIVPLCGGLT